MILLDNRTFAYHRRNALSIEEVNVKSSQIVQRLLPYLHGRVGIYMAYGKEVSVEALRLHQEFCFCAPVTLQNYEMKFYQIDEHTLFEQHAYGIWEPIGTLEVLPEHIDCMIIPIVAFDEHKHRLGHGKGYYDRYLASYKGVKIGVAFECQKVEAIQCNSHDVDMDVIVTEDAIYL